MIHLIEGCYASDIKVKPANWETEKASIKKKWYIYYRFYDPRHKEDYPKGKLRILKGMNEFNTLEERQTATKAFIKQQEDILKVQHYNFITKEFMTPAFERKSELSPDTPFIEALNIALTKVEAVPETITDIKSVVKGVDIAARKLEIHEYPIKDISRKHFAAIFEKCKDNPKFSKNRQNVYRKWLIKLYKTLFKMEAVESNPLKDIEKEKVVKRERVLPTVTQRKQINEFLRKNYYHFWRCMQIFFTSDARQKELFRVQAKHINLEDQSVLYLVKKGQEERWVRRPIVDAALFLWEEILSECKSEEDFIFSYGLIPGKKQISSTQFGRRWQRHIKGTAKRKVKTNSRKKNYQPPKKLNIDVDLNSLRHQSITELMDILDKTYDPIKEVMQMTGHKSEKMIAKVYDINNVPRKNDKVKKTARLF